VNPLGQSFAAATVTVTREVDPVQLAAFRSKLQQLRSLRPGPLVAALGQAVHHIALR
jgi:hypothetical protein